MTPHVTIKQRVTAEGHPFSESFVYFGGQTYYSRNWSVITDSPHARQALAQQFLDRLKRFPSTTTYEHRLESVREAFAEIKRTDRIVSIAKADGPPAQSGRPALKLVE
jgi:hypothetical protein